MEARTISKPLDLKQALSTRKQPVKLLTKTPDNKLVFQGVVDGAVLTTDLYGRQILRTKQPADAQSVFNASGPDDVIFFNTTRQRFTVGQPVFTLRTLSRHCKIHVGTVQGFNNKGVLVKLDPESHALMHSKKGMTHKGSSSPDGVINAPHSVVFSDPQKLSDFVEKFQTDFEEAVIIFARLRGPRS